jgi:lipopolysaccharide export system protein LptA
MKFLPLFLLLALAPAALRAQTADAPPPGSTVVDSDELRIDQVARTALFTGNVVVTGDNFNMKCQEMTVYFTKDSKVDNIVAKGDVVIEQPGRVTHSGEAQYFRDDDKFVLTDQPTILDNKNQISAPEITIYRTRQSLFTKGRTTTTIQNAIGAPTTAPSPTDAK